MQNPMFRPNIFATVQIQLFCFVLTCFSHNIPASLKSIGRWNIRMDRSMSFYQTRCKSFCINLNYKIDYTSVKK